MAAIALGPGADATRCPRCHGVMCPPKRGARPSTRHLWFRTCRDLEHCGATTYTSEVPSFVHEPPAPPVLGRQQALPIFREDL